MTLVVGMKVPDGLVIATDSLVTTQILKPIRIAGVTSCGQCGHKQETQIEVPILTPSSISPNAQKLFPLRSRFGIGTFGSGIVNGKSMYTHFKVLDKKVVEQDIKSLSSLVDFIRAYFEEQLKKEAEQRKITLQAGIFPFGFKIAGYENEEQDSGEIVSLQIGLNSKIESQKDFGCTVSGDPHVVQKIWSKLMSQDGKVIPTPEPAWMSITLQDAIDYSEFLIRTTADYQKFANMIPTVGGPIDVALITTHSGFRWIKHKKLSELLDEE